MTPANDNPVVTLPAKSIYGTFDVDVKATLDCYSTEYWHKLNYTYIGSLRSSIYNTR